MIKNFDNITVLTSQNPEAFLTFINNGDSSLSFIISPDASLPSNTLFINGRYVRQDGDYIIININTLKVFNERNKSSVINYDYSPGDRVTFLWYGSVENKIWFDNPYVDVEVVSFDIVVDSVPEPDVTNYELKVRLNSSIDVNDISDKTLYFELYTPKKRAIVAGDTTTYLTTLFYEIGEQYNIVNGVHEKSSGVITDGDVYFKTRDLVTPNDASTYKTYIAEDFNFSDLYASKFTSYGRGFQYNERDGVKIRKASIRYSDKFLIDSKINLLNRFYAERLFGEGDGETTSNYGWIRKIRQRGNYLVCIQEINSCHIPIFSTIVEDQAGQNQAYLSDKLFNIHVHFRSPVFLSLQPLPVSVSSVAVPLLPTSSPDIFLVQLP